MPCIHFVIVVMASSGVLVLASSTVDKFIHNEIRFSAVGVVCIHDQCSNF